jgi:outer membrane protein assembly factor BamA
MRPQVLLALAFSIYPLFVNAECDKKRDYRSNKNGGIVVADLKITAAGQIGSNELSKILNNFTGSCFNDDQEEVEERLRAAFQRRGYFLAEVKNLRIKPLDVLAKPKPVDLDAEVAEGQRHRLAQIEFVGNHSFSAKRLRQQFPLKTGDVFDRDKIAGGLESLFRLYAPRGYVDLFFIPDTRALSDARVDLIVTVNEGKQYRMGALHIQAKKELSERLRQNWELAEGRPFDRTYLPKFIDANRSLLPKDFTQEGNTGVYRDCDDGTVQVVVQVDLTPPTPPVTQDAGCQSPQDETR